MPIKSLLNKFLNMLFKSFVYLLFINIWIIIIDEYLFCQSFDLKGRLLPTYNVKHVKKSFSACHMANKIPQPPYHKHKKTLINGFKKMIFASSILTVNNKLTFAANNFQIPKCSDAITILKSPNSRDIILIGTAHISEDSAKLVRSVILESKPDVVMIELDKKRLGKIASGKTLEDLGFLLPKQASLQETLSDEYSQSSAPTKPSLFSALNVMTTQIKSWVKQSGDCIKTFIYLHIHIYTHITPLIIFI